MFQQIKNAFLDAKFGKFNNYRGINKCNIEDIKEFKIQIIDTFADFLKKELFIQEVYFKQNQGLQLY